MTAVQIVGRVGLLVVLLLLARIMGALAAGLGGGSAPAPTDATGASGAAGVLLTLTAVGALEVLAWVYPVRRAIWVGWRLTAVVFAVTFGVMSVQSQIEAIFFRVIPVELSLRVVLSGLVTSALFAPLAVLLLGRWRTPASPSAAPSVQLAPRAWIARLSAAAALHVVLYVVFGQLVAWQSADVRAFYGAESTSGWDTFGLVAIPTLGPWQAARGVLWAVLALPVFRMLPVAWWKAGIAVGVLFAVIMNAQLLLPNAHMPLPVRLVHLVETASSNFLLGLGLAWLFARR